MDATMVFPTLAALLHLTLHHLEGVRVDDSLVVVLHIVLRDFALIDLLFLRQVIDGVGFCRRAQPLYFSFDRMLTHPLAIFNSLCKSNFRFGQCL